MLPPCAASCCSTARSCLPVRCRSVRRVVADALSLPISERITVLRHLPYRCAMR